MYDQSHNKVFCILYIEGILPKGPYLPCLRMADRALLAGYPRHVEDTDSLVTPTFAIDNTWVERILRWKAVVYKCRSKLVTLFLQWQEYRQIAVERMKVIYVCHQWINWVDYIKILIRRLLSLNIGDAKVLITNYLCLTQEIRKS